MTTGGELSVDLGHPGGVTPTLVAVTLIQQRLNVCKAHLFCPDVGPEIQQEIVELGLGQPVHQLTHAPLTFLER